jgi:hypothetical protein
MQFGRFGRGPAKIRSNALSGNGEKPFPLTYLFGGLLKEDKQKTPAPPCTTRRLSETGRRLRSRSLSWHFDIF